MHSCTLTGHTETEVVVHNLLKTWLFFPQNIDFWTWKLIHINTDTYNWMNAGEQREERWNINTLTIPADTKAADVYILLH